jgi:hypothetical protein
VDYARSFELQGRDDDALRQYQSIVPRYSGEEARCRYALLLKRLNRVDEAKAQFREVIQSVRNGPSSYRSRQREWVKIARANVG